MSSYATGFTASRGLATVRSTRGLPHSTFPGGNSVKYGDRADDYIPPLLRATTHGMQRPNNQSHSQKPPHASRTVYEHRNLLGTHLGMK